MSYFHPWNQWHGFLFHQLAPNSPVTPPPSLAQSLAVMTVPGFGKKAACCQALRGHRILRDPSFHAVPEAVQNMNPLPKGGPRPWELGTDKDRLRDPLLPGWYDFRIPRVHSTSKADLKNTWKSKVTLHFINSSLDQSVANVWTRPSHFPTNPSTFEGTWTLQIHNVVSNRHGEQFSDASGRFAGP